MLLALDGRNRHLSVGFYAEGECLATARFGVAPERSSDEYCFFLEAAWERARRRGAAEDPGEAWISSVVPSLTPKLAEAVHRAWGLTATLVGPGVRTGLKIRTDFPSEVGSDLVCAAVAAKDLVGSPCLVVSFGAVLSVSAVDAAGDFVGAAFAPGMASAAESLREVAAQIPEVRLARPPSAIGRSTVSAVQAGLHYGYGGLLARLLGAMGAELAAGGAAGGEVGTDGVRVPVVGCGDEEGRAILAAEAPGPFVPDLVLEGLYRIAELAQPPKDAPMSGPTRQRA